MNTRIVRFWRNAEPCFVLGLCVALAGYGHCEDYTIIVPRSNAPAATETIPNSAPLSPFPVPAQPAPPDGLPFDLASRTKSVAQAPFPAEPLGLPNPASERLDSSTPQAVDGSMCQSLTWGIAGIRIYPYGERTGPNGVEYDQLFALDLDLNIWLCRRQGLYLFIETQFWGQKSGIGVTNSSQGPFDFSKREFDFNLGLAWNYWDRLEARMFAYSANNLNRGVSLAKPAGFNDGIGLENRLYLGAMYDKLRSADFDPTKATFVSIGYFPSKDLVDTDGVLFHPGAFARAYLTCALLGEQYYGFLDAELIARRTVMPKLFHASVGVAARPWACAPRLEFRIGEENLGDFQNHEIQIGFFVACRVIF